MKSRGKGNKIQLRKPRLLILHFRRREGRHRRNVWKLTVREKAHKARQVQQKDRPQSEMMTLDCSMQVPVPRIQMAKFRLQQRSFACKRRQRANELLRLEVTRNRTSQVAQVATATAPDSHLGDHLLYNREGNLRLVSAEMNRPKTFWWLIKRARHGHLKSRGCVMIMRLGHPSSQIRLHNLHQGETIRAQGQLHEKKFLQAL